VLEDVIEGAQDDMGAAEACSKCRELVGSGVIYYRIVMRQELAKRNMNRSYTMD
jgi:hypothetical protein